MLDILKILFCTPFLIYSCYSDIKTRRVSDKVWLIMLTGFIFFILYDISKYGISYLYDFSRLNLPYLPQLLISVGLTFLFLELYEQTSNSFNLRMMGGADAKLLLIISIFFPTYPTFQAIHYVFPLNTSLNLFSFSVVGNAVIIAMSIPIGFAIYNLIKMGLQIDNPLYIFIGYKSKISELANKQVWICQDFKEINGKIESYYKRGGIEIDDEIISKFQNLLEKGLIKDEIWVTPKIPFMIPLSIGFLVAVFYGDLMLEIVKYLFLKI